MQTRNRHAFTTIHTEGALLPADLLQRIRANDSNLEGLTPESYHLAPGEKLNEAVNRSWNRLTGIWGGFQHERGRLGQTDPGTGMTRDRWLLPLFQELGFGRFTISRAVEIEGKSYPISHHWENVPLHLVGCGLELDRRAPGVAGASRTSPHSLVQEYLNRADDAQWGVVSNGLNLRVLRDNAALTRQAYIEFDLESMFEGEIYSDFVLLWLIGHQSRFETYVPPATSGTSGGRQAGGDCILERWSKSAQESGTRALDDLRRGVEEAIVSLGQGFMQHSQNKALVSRLKKGDLSAQDYYRQLLRLVYRLIFLFAAEDRDLLLLPGAPVEACQRYQNYYSTGRLRSLAERQRGSRHHDRYEALRLVMTLLGSDQGSPELALPALGGFLFDPQSTADVNEAKLDNQSLLTAVRSLAFITESSTRRAVDYRNLGPEELGSVYESLLELHPLLNTDAGTFQLTSAAGNERKTTGSYYTPSSLIQVLLDSALDPVIDDRVGAHRDAPEQEDALLSLKVCDPACGSGHFLIAAAHRIAGRLAQVRAGGDEPSPNEARRALRDVIRHCIYGVDVNPMAVELCKVNLWLESLEPGKPLSFLDAHIKCGNSLVGVGPKMELDNLIVPDEAFNPVTGDHRATASLLKKRNKQEREGQESLFVTVIKTREDLEQWLADRTRALEAMPEDSTAEVQAKAAAYQQVNQSAEYLRQRQIADLWTAAFFWQIEEPKRTDHEVVAPTHGQLQRLRNGRPVQSGLMEKVTQLALSEGFFHWPIEFAEVDATGGFDCLMGNPPWEMLQLEEQEFFASRDPVIAILPGEKRKRAIKELRESNPSLSGSFEDAKHIADAQNKFFRTSGRYPLTATGKMNSYALFAEHFRGLMNLSGRAGVIVPTGIATDDTTKDFFGDLVEKRTLATLFDFENKEAIFPGVHRSYKFCLLTLSYQPIQQAQFIFFATRVEHLRDERRRFSLDPAEIALFNPNTRTMPVFRTRMDAQLTRKIYLRVPILVNEHTSVNPWGVNFKQGFFNMTSDSGKFVIEPKEGYVRLYEAKMFHQFDHRWATYDNYTDVRDTLVREKINPAFEVSPRYWVPKKDVVEQIENWPYKWFLVFRGVGRSTDERTSIYSIVPLVGLGNSAPVMEIKISHPRLAACLLGCLNSLVFDFFVRFKVPGININFFIVKQYPVLAQKHFSTADIDYVCPRVVELVFTANDVKNFAMDMGFTNLPFRWDEERRAMLRAELDAYYARLYGLTRDELRYILDPQDVYGPDFPGETFRVLKEKEIKQFGEYRTRRLVLEAWDRLEGVEVGNLDVYQAQSAIVPPKQETILVSQPKSESRPVAVQTQRPATAKPPLPVTPPSKVVKEIDQPAGQPTLTDFGLYKCEVCGKMVMGFEIEDHKNRMHSGDNINFNQIR